MLVNRFDDPQMEADFHSEFFQSALNNIRLGVVAGTFVWALFIPIDVSGYGSLSEVPADVAVVRIGVLLALIAGCLLSIKPGPKVVANSDIIIPGLVLTLTAGTAYILYVWDFPRLEKNLGLPFDVGFGNFKFIFFVFYAVLISLAATQFHMRERGIIAYLLFLSIITAIVYLFSDPSALLFSFFALGYVVASLLVLASSTTLEKSARAEFLQARIINFERDKNRRLLLSILPESVADQIPSDGSHASVVKGYEGISVLFTDITSFTPLVERLSPHQLIGMLNEVFAELDRIAKSHGIEKIKTIGDAYMMAAGVPLARKDHAEAIALCALDIAKLSGSMKDPEGNPIRFRIGIHTGPGVAGVIGSHKFAYDIWGSTVNTAARMEAYGEPGRVHASDEIHELLKDHMDFEYRGEIDVKGKGRLKTWWLLGARNTAPVA